ncbi:MAG: SRPBCC domain-containing protein [Roseibium sp.]|uniref:SRPBCC family protein n=1 Tax=Roseibium sp. TaxID=1936156 RepID=UPI00261CF4AD|nr:SRPBCC domain-containing protein [Roseibium sp.]MCV0423947.1 SRPBCC domain-containing protein [Roseibium sp.]
MPDYVSDDRITIVRRCRTPRELVWKVWTDARHVAAWWGPFGPEETSAEIDARVGGVYYVGLCAPDGSEHPSRGIISELVPQKKIVIEGDPDAPDACGAGLPPRAIVTVLFEDDSLGTRVTLDALFVSETARTDAETQGYLTSWSATLDVLDTYYENVMASE